MAPRKHVMLSCWAPSMRGAMLGLASQLLLALPVFPFLQVQGKPAKAHCT